MTHVLVYAEVLFRWKLLHKRIELLKAVDPFLRPPSDPSLNLDQSQLGGCFPPSLIFFEPVVASSVFLGQAHPFCVHSAVNRQPHARNLRALHVVLAAEYLDVPYAAFLSKACPGLLNDRCFVKMLTSLSLRPLIPLFGVQSCLPSIVLEVTPECGLLNWLFVPSPSYISLVTMSNASGRDVIYVFIISPLLVQNQLVHALNVT